MVGDGYELGASVGQFHHFRSGCPVPLCIPNQQAGQAARDARDSGRAVAPLKAAEDALTMDTTDLSPDEVFDRALSYIAARLE